MALRWAGLKTDGSAFPVPHSESVKVLGPKWRNMDMDPSCHWSCWDEGRGVIGRGCGFSGVDLDRERSEEKKRRVSRDI